MPVDPLLQRFGVSGSGAALPQRPGPRPVQGRRADPLLQRFGVGAPVNPMDVPTEYDLPADQQPGPDAPRQATTQFLTKASNLFEAPLTILGADMMDFERRHQRGESAAQALHDLLRQTGWAANEITLGPREGNRAPIGPSLRHALALMHQWQFGEAAQNYSTTSLAANRTRARLGDVGAQFFDRNPGYFSTAVLGEEALNPSNVALGEAGTELGEAARLGLRGVGKGVGAVARAAGRATAGRAGAARAAEGMIPRYAAAMEHGPLNRFAEIRAAAAEVANRGHAVPETWTGPLQQAIPRTVGPDAVNAADRAERIAGQFANTGRATSGANDKIVMRIFGGMTPDEQFEAVQRYEEGAGQVPGVAAARTPLGQEAPRFSPQAEARINRAAGLMRQFFPEFDARQMAFDLLTPERQLRSTPYFPRGGMYRDEGLNSEEEAINDAFLGSSRSRGGMNVRRGTARERPAMHRTYDTMRQARASGKMHPEASPAEALEEFLNQRTQNLLIEQRMRELGQLGLVTDAEHAPPNFVPWTNIGSVRQFGSPYLRERFVHPAVARLVEDTVGTPSRTSGLASIEKTAGQVGAGINRAFSRLLTAFWGYHGFVNLPQTTIAKMATLANNPRGWATFVRELASGKGLVRAPDTEAMRVGATLPHAPALRASIRAIPLRARSPQDLAATALTTPARLSSDPLFGRIEPWIGNALYKGLRASGMPEDRAVLETREALGAPEQIRRGDAGANLFMFPAWLLSQMKLWPKALARGFGPLYAGPHRAVAAHNLARGVSATDPFTEQRNATSLIPPIVLGRTPQGDINELSLGSPANRPLEVLNLLGNAAMGNTNGQGEEALRIGEYAANPVISMVARMAFPPPGQSDLSRELAEYAPASASTLLQTALRVGAYYSPVRTGTSGQSQPGSAFGIGTTTELSPDRARQRNEIERRFLSGFGYGRRRVRGIEALRKEAAAIQADNPAQAAELNAQADRLWQVMVTALQAQGLPAPVP